MKEPTPFNIFYNARSYYAAAHFLDQQKRPNLLVFPTIVCESLSLELHLKTLHVLRKRWEKIRKNHHIRELFALLSQSDQRRIKNHLKQILQVHPHYDVASDKAGLFKIDSILDRANTMFVNARYWHECPIPTDAKGRASNAAIGPLTDAIMLLILELRPDWTEEKMRSAEFDFISRKQQST
jgi:hypothetical protein